PARRENLVRVDAKPIVDVGRHYEGAARIHLVEDSVGGGDTSVEDDPMVTVLERSDRFFQRSKGRTSASTIAEVARTGVSRQMEGGREVNGGRDAVAPLWRDPAANRNRGCAELGDGPACHASLPVESDLRLVTRASDESVMRILGGERAAA